MTLRPVIPLRSSPDDSVTRVIYIGEGCERDITDEIMVSRERPFSSSSFPCTPKLSRLLSIAALPKTKWTKTPWQKALGRRFTLPKSTAQTYAHSCRADTLTHLAPSSPTGRAPRAGTVSERRRPHPGTNHRPSRSAPLQKQMKIATQSENTIALVQVPEDSPINIRFCLIRDQTLRHCAVPHPRRGAIGEGAQAIGWAVGQHLAPAAAQGTHSLPHIAVLLIVYNRQHGAFSSRPSP